MRRRCHMAAEHIYFALFSTVPHLRPLFGKMLTAPRRVWPILLAAANYVLSWGLGFGEHRACDKRYLLLTLHIQFQPDVRKPAQDRHYPLIAGY